MRDDGGVSRKEALELARTTVYEIYALLDPRDMMPRYVGRSRNAAKRLNGHLGDHLINIPKAAWLTELARIGRRPHLVVLAKVVGALNAVECEQFWTDTGRARGWPLLNGVGSRFKGNLGLGRASVGRYWTLDALKLRPQHWEVA